MTNSEARKRAQEAAETAENSISRPASPQPANSPSDALAGTQGVEAIRARADAATPGPWLWQGNIDTGEPYLAGRGPGMGASVLAVGAEDRSTTGRAAENVRSYARECGEDPEEMVADWATDRYDEPIKEPRLWFYTDHMAVTARDRVTFEVAPNATHRDDPAVYRADIVGIRHPDAEFIAHARTDIPLLLAALDEARAEVNHWKDHAEEAGRGFAQVCRDAARISARNVVLATALEDAIDELVECRSFISVETRHYPTVSAINEKVEQLRAALTPTTTETEDES